MRRSPVSEPTDRSCYGCVHHSVCSFAKSAERLLDDHIGWYDVNLVEPDWQRMYDVLALMCTRYVAPAAVQQPHVNVGPPTGV